jgi:L-methionine (R)-S-oxide reductase
MDTNALVLPDASLPPAERHAALTATLAALMAGERDAIANCANAAALLFYGLPEVNWAGVYLLRGAELVVGPFQGRPACVRIALGRGVCGTAAERRSTIIVPDVHEFPGHIACDSASVSEIVVPLVAQSRLVAVLDLDSPRRARFTELDARGLEAFAATLAAGSDWP